MFDAITDAPENVLVVRCEDKYARMSCVSDQENETTIAWTYDGSVKVSQKCSSHVPDVFQAIPVGTMQCNIAAWLENATYNRPNNTLSISGPYGCTDQTSNGVTHTSLVVVLGTLRNFLHFFMRSRDHRLNVGVR